MLTSRAFYLGQDQEAGVPLCAHPRGLCGICVQVTDGQPFDCVTLYERACAWTSRRLYAGRTLYFGFLPPGRYLLALRRRGRLLRLALELPPGGNVVLRCGLEKGSCCWKQQFCRGFWNAT